MPKAGMTVQEPAGEEARTTEMRSPETKPSEPEAPWVREEPVPRTETIANESRTRYEVMRHQIP